MLNKEKNNMLEFIIPFALDEQDGGGGGGRDEQLLVSQDNRIMKRAGTETDVKQQHHQQLPTIISQSVCQPMLSSSLNKTSQSRAYHYSYNYDYCEYEN